MSEWTYDIVVCCVKFVEETRRTPSTSDDNQGLLRRIVGKLGSRSAFLVSNVVETRSGDDQCSEGEATDCLESPTPSRDANLVMRGCREWTRE